MNRARVRLLLVTGASALAVTAALTGARAADLPAVLPLKAPPAVDNGQFRAFVEGGGFWTAGDPVQALFPILGTTNGFTSGQGVLALRPSFGWDAAAGFDYRFAGSPWHVSAQFRYGEARSSAASPVSSLNIPGAFGPGSSAVGSQSSTATDRETHWLADFAFGRDIDLGANRLQWKAGLRIAEVGSQLTTETNGTLAFTGVPLGIFGFANLTELNNVTNSQNAGFRGAGPRIGFEGTLPLAGAWQLDYLADAAVLFGTRRMDNPVTTLFSTSPLILLNSTTAATANQHGATVPNLDAQVGLSYWINPALKATASYRVDAYFGAIPTFDPNGSQTVVNRIFHGPRLTLTGLLSPEPRTAPSGLAATVLAAPPGPRGELTVFVTGGAFWTGGDPIYTFYPGTLSNPGFFALTPTAGWNAGGGFDYRVAGSPWHLGAAFDYGEARRSATASDAFNGVAAPFIAPGVTISSSQVVTSPHRETHWTADAAIGHDISVGADTIQLKAGVRVAELKATTSTLAKSALSFSGPNPFPISGVMVTSASIFDTAGVEQASRFRGAGPRIGVEGSLPLRGGFTLDVASDAAVLFGTQSFESTRTVSASATSTPPGALGGTVINTITSTAMSQNAAVFNADIQAGISYWLTRNLKLTASYRLDAFFGALVTLDANGNQTKVDRYFHGPRVTATANF